LIGVGYWNKYVKLHKQKIRGWHHSDGVKRKLSISNKKTHAKPEVVKEKKERWKRLRKEISKKHKERWAKNPEMKVVASKRLKKLWKKEEYREKFSQKWTEEQKKEIGRRSKAAWTKERRELQSKTRCGPDNNNWRGGISNLPYCFEWTDDLKEYVKERDGDKCQNPDGCDNKNLAVHHIDYDKQNCNPSNLITLCMNCNSKANGNRDFWKNLYRDMINDS